jgi:hypothetical protein
VIWLEAPDGERHTWGDDTVLDTFELTGLRDLRFRG